MLHCLRLLKPDFAFNNLNENPNERKTQFISFLMKFFFPRERLWPTIFHDSENFVIIIDGRIWREGLVSRGVHENTHIFM